MMGMRRMGVMLMMIVIGSIYRESTLCTRYSASQRCPLFMRTRSDLLPCYLKTAMEDWKKLASHAPAGYSYLRIYCTYSAY